MATVKKAKAIKKDIAASYNSFKKFHGEEYTGMKIGRGHKWLYDKNEWKETKVTPDKWEFTYSTVKRRKGKAPEGSGVPVGTKYHWYILSHQFAEKLDANTYTIVMTGLKFKLAHKRADHDKWNITEKGKCKRLIRILKEFVAELEQHPDEPLIVVEPEVAATVKKTSPKNKSEKKTAATPKPASSRLRSETVRRRKSTVA